MYKAKSDKYFKELCELLKKYFKNKEDGKLTGHIALEIQELLKEIDKCC